MELWLNIEELRKKPLDAWPESTSEALGINPFSESPFQLL